MSEKYIPLYRKYRPQTFYDLIGQEHITKALSNAIELNRISHAYLFCGPRGTGKTSSARILAKSLNCQDGPTLKPCGVCPSCVDITNTTPMDVIEIDAASNRGVEDTQKIIEKIQYVPVHGRYKIYVIDEVHQLSTHSFNALLKTLEEPPENVIFILATTEPQKVLDTVISRCQRFDFRRITTDDIVKRLKYISENEKINISDDALYTIAKSSAGGMRDSLSLLDQVSILDAEKQITTEDIETLLGKISNDVLFDITELILGQKTADCLELISEIYSKGNEAVQILNNLVQYLRNLLILQNFTEKDAVKNLTQLSDEYLKKMSVQSKKADAPHFVYIIEKIAKYIKEIKVATNPYMWLELCFIDLTCTQFESYEKLLQRIEKLESGCVTPIIHTVPATKNATVASSVDQKTQVQQPTQSEQENYEVVAIPKSELSTQVETEVPQKNISMPAEQTSEWDSLLQNIAQTPSRILFTSQGIPVEISKEQLVISFKNDFLAAQAKDAPKFNALKKAAETYFDVTNINIKIIVDPNATSLAGTKKKIVEELPPETNNTVDEKGKKEYYTEHEVQYKEPDKSDEKMPSKFTSDQARLIVELFNGKIIE